MNEHKPKKNILIFVFPKIYKRFNTKYFRKFSNILIILLLLIYIRYLFNKSTFILF